jgi:hypothetical protein
LEHAWEYLYSEYCTISGGQSYKLLINLSKDIGYLESKLLIIGLCLKVLQHRPDEYCIKKLAAYGYRYQWDVSNIEQYAKNLDEIANRAGGVRFAIDQKRAELEKSRDRIEGKEITRETFTRTLAALSKHMGFRIDPRQTTVTEYVAYRHNYEREIEAIRRANEKENIQSKSSSNLR